MLWIIIKKKRPLEFGGIVSLSVPEFDLELRWWDSGKREGKTQEGVSPVRKREELCPWLPTQTPLGLFSAPKISVVAMDALRTSASSLSRSVRE